MEITDRIELIIKHQGLTSSQFADQIGVQRSSMSHIVSGRNKPSLDFINKVLTKFNFVNSEWLLFGKGQMAKELIQKSLFDIPETPPSNNQSIKAEKNSNDFENTTPFATEREHIEKKTEKETKSIDFITIFYNDGSCKTYKP